MSEQLIFSLLQLFYWTPPLRNFLMFTELDVIENDPNHTEKSQDYFNNYFLLYCQEIIINYADYRFCYLQSIEMTNQEDILKETEKRNKIINNYNQFNLENFLKYLNKTYIDENTNNKNIISLIFDIKEKNIEKFIITLELDFDDLIFCPYKKNTYSNTKKINFNYKLQNKNNITYNLSCLVFTQTINKNKTFHYFIKIKNSKFTLISEDSLEKLFKPRDEKIFVGESIEELLNNILKHEKDEFIFEIFVYEKENK